MPLSPSTPRRELEERHAGMHGVGAAVGEHAAGMHRARRLLVRADELMMEKELRIRDSRIPARGARLPVMVGNSASASPMALEVEEMAARI
jgi:hypothetical protein